MCIYMCIITKRREDNPFILSRLMFVQNNVHALTHCYFQDISSHEFLEEKRDIYSRQNYIYPHAHTHTHSLNRYTPKQHTTISYRSYMYKYVNTYTTDTRTQHIIQTTVVHETIQSFCRGV